MKLVRTVSAKDRPARCHRKFRQTSPRTSCLRHVTSGRHPLPFRRPIMFYLAPARKRPVRLWCAWCCWIRNEVEEVLYNNQWRIYDTIKGTYYHVCMATSHYCYSGHADMIVWPFNDNINTPLVILQNLCSFFFTEATMCNQIKYYY